MSKYYKRYKLLKDTHLLKAGTELKFQAFDGRFGDDWQASNSKQLFTMSDMQNTEWFEPQGDQYELFPPAPTDMDEHFHLLPETRHNNMCDFCRAYEKLSNSTYIGGQVAKLLAETYEVWREPYSKELDS